MMVRPNNATRLAAEAETYIAQCMIHEKKKSVVLVLRGLAGFSDMARSLFGGSHANRQSNANNRPSNADPSFDRS